MYFELEVLKQLLFGFEPNISRTIMWNSSKPFAYSLRLGSVRLD